MTKVNWYTPISAHVAAEIIRKTRANTSKPINEEALANELNRAFFAYCADRSIDARSRAHAYKALKLIRSRAKFLRNVLIDSSDVGIYLTHLAISIWRVELATEEDTLMRPAAEYRMFVNRAFATFCKMLDLFLKQVDTIIREGPPAKFSMSPIFELIAVRLPDIYTRHFLLTFGAGSSGNGLPSGPGIRFVLASLNAASITNQCGKSYSSQTVRTYWRNARRGKFRRKDKMRRKT